MQRLLVVAMMTSISFGMAQRKFMVDNRKSGSDLNAGVPHDMYWSLYGGSNGLDGVRAMESLLVEKVKKSLNPVMGEGAYLSSEEVMKKTTSKNYHCEDAGQEAEKWHDCLAKSGGDYQDGYKIHAPKSGAVNAFVGVAMSMFFLAHFF